MRLFYFIPDFFTSWDYQERWKDFLKDLRELGCSGFRVFLQYSWPPYKPNKANVLSPYTQVGLWKAGYDNAPDMPFYNALSFSDSWLNMIADLRDFLKEEWPECQPILTLHDYCSIKQDGWKKYFYPFLSSYPDRDKDDADINRFPHGFWGLDSIDGRKTVWCLHQAYIEKIMEIFEGIDYLIEFCNEDEVKDWPDSYAYQYYQHVKKLIGDRLLVSGRWACIQPETLYSQHGIIRPIDLSLLPPVKPEFLILSGDGASGGDGPADELNRRGLGESMIYPLVKWLKDNNFYAYEFMDRGLWRKDVNRATLGCADFELLKKLTKEMGLYKEPEQPKVKVVVCKESGLVPRETCPEVQEEEFLLGEEPRETCPLHALVDIPLCEQSKKIPFEWCPQSVFKIFAKDWPSLHCDVHKPPCKYWLKKKNFKRWIKCLFKKLNFKK